jgi:hypothetical protein
MRMQLALWLAVFFAGGLATCSAAISHFGAISGESRDPSQVARILPDSSEPGWLRPVGSLGALAMVAGLVGAAHAIKRRGRL